MEPLVNIPKQKNKALLISLAIICVLSVASAFILFTDILTPAIVPVSTSTIPVVSDQITDEKVYRIFLVADKKYAHRGDEVSLKAVVYDSKTNQPVAGMPISFSLGYLTTDSYPDLKDATTSSAGEAFWSGPLNTRWFGSGEALAKTDLDQPFILTRSGWDSRLVTNRVILSTNDDLIGNVAAITYFPWKTEISVDQNYDPVSNDVVFRVSAQDIIISADGQNFSKKPAVGKKINVIKVDDVGDSSPSGDRILYEPATLASLATDQSGQAVFTLSAKDYQKTKELGASQVIVFLDPASADYLYDNYGGRRVLTGIFDFVYNINKSFVEQKSN